MNYDLFLREQGSEYSTRIASFANKFDGIAFIDLVAEIEGEYSLYQRAMHIYQLNEEFLIKRVNKKPPIKGVPSITKTKESST